MKLTSITRDLSTQTQRLLTAHSSSPQTELLQVSQTVQPDDLGDLRPFEVGELFHASCAALLGEEKLLKAGRPLYPFVNTLRSHLRALGFRRFFPEFQLHHGHVAGRADLIAVGSGKRSVVEFKVTNKLPAEPDAETMIQGASYGYMLEEDRRPQETGLILYYVSLERGQIMSFRWANFHRASRPVRELQAA